MGIPRAPAPHRSLDHYAPPLTHIPAPLPFPPRACAEKDEYEQNIIADIAALGIVGDAVSHTSDYFDVICDYARCVGVRAACHIRNIAFASHTTSLNRTSHRPPTHSPTPSYPRSKMLREGHAYMDDTPREAMQEERMKMLNSVHRCVGSGEVGPGVWESG